LVETFAALSAVFGSAAVLWELRLRMRFAVWCAFVSKLREQAVDGVTIWALLRVELRRSLAKLGILRKGLFFLR
jgi:hypothetical protein